MNCIVDASFSTHTNKVGVEICIRNEHGEFVVAKADCFTPQCEVDIGETLGLLSIIEWVCDLHIGLVDFELDSKVVIDTVDT